MTINALIIDDEVSSRNVLKQLLLKFCPEIIICGESDNADNAYLLIQEKKTTTCFSGYTHAFGKRIYLTS
jgi:two-component system LytT family response regulator